MSSGASDHLPAFSVNPPGTLVLRRHWDGDDTWLTIITADPHVEFNDELLTELFNDVDYQGAGPGYIGMWIDLSSRNCTTHDWQCPQRRGICYLDGLIHIEARDQHVIYQVTGYNAQRNSWRASWPD